MKVHSKTHSIGNRRGQRRTGPGVSSTLAKMSADMHDPMVAMLLAKTNLSANCFSTEPLQIVLRMAGFVPVSRKSAMLCVTRESSRVHGLLREQILALKGSNANFALTLDEWNWKGTKYLGMTLHCSEKFPSFGGHRVEMLNKLEDGAAAEDLLTVLNSSLETLGLLLGDIQAMTTDGITVQTMINLLHVYATPPVRDPHMRKVDKLTSQLFNRR